MESDATVCVRLSPVTSRSQSCEILASRAYAGSFDSFRRTASNTSRAPSPSIGPRCVRAEADSAAQKAIRLGPSMRHALSCSPSTATSDSRCTESWAARSAIRRESGRSSRGWLTR